MTAYLVRFRPRKVAPVEMLKPGHQSQARQILADLEDVLGDLIAPVQFSEMADLENSWEELWRLWAAVKTFPVEDTWFQPIGWKGGGPVNLGGKPRPVTFDVEWGPEKSSVRTYSHAVPDVFPYWDYTTFQRHAGRNMVVAGFRPDDPSALDIDQACQRLGGDHFFVKGTDTKTFVTTGHLKDGRFVDANDGWTLIRLEGSADTLLVQQHVEMRHEYRFYVVGGRPVAGAWVREDALPFDSIAAFEDLDVAGPGELVGEYLRFAEVFSDELHREDPELGFYVLDVATVTDPDGTDRAVAIELNQPGAAGFYAVDPRDVSAALMP